MPCTVEFVAFGEVDVEVLDAQGEPIVGAELLACQGSGNTDESGHTGALLASAGDSCGITVFCPPSTDVHCYQNFVVAGIEEDVLSQVTVSVETYRRSKLEDVWAFLAANPHNEPPSRSAVWETELEQLQALLDDGELPKEEEAVVEELISDRERKLGR